MITLLAEQTRCDVPFWFQMDAFKLRKRFLLCRGNRLNRSKWESYKQFHQTKENQEATALLDAIFGESNE
jgi:hypothetical protein